MNAMFAGRRDGCGVFVDEKVYEQTWCCEIEVMMVSRVL
jgi:hypothetical protein